MSGRYGFRVSPGDRVHLISADPYPVAKPAEPVKGKSWNVLVPVVKVIDADSAGDAIEALRAEVTAAGFEVYDGAVTFDEPACDAFPSDVNAAGEEIR